MLTGSSSLSSTYKSRSSRRDPLLWQVPNRQDGHLLTVHKAPVESPGPRYNLQAPPLNSSGTSRASQGFYSTSKDVVFPRARRMPDGNTSKKCVIRDAIHTFCAPFFCRTVSKSWTVTSVIKSPCCIITTEQRSAKI